MVIAALKKDVEHNQVFAYGREDANGHHLACTPAEAAKEDDFIRHLKRFDHLKVYRVEAGAKCSFVCCEGEPELLYNRYMHPGIECSLCKRGNLSGPIHFSVIDKTFTYFCQ
jgi:hypothetical protein